MSTTTPNLTLTLYDSTTDQVVTFATFRAVWGGTATTSNFYRIDTWAGTVNSSISTLQNQRGSIPVSAAYISANYYEATVSSISAYTTGMTILLSLDTSSAGTVTLNINALGTKSVMKIDSSGSPVNIADGELQSGRLYVFEYDGTRWVWVNATSSDQIYVVSGTSGNFLSVASDGSIQDSGYNNSTYAPASKGVTNGDTHNHIGGDGDPITEGALSFSDVTTGNVSTSNHGLHPKLPNNIGFYLDGVGNYSSPFGFRNVLINGDMTVCQRPSPFTSGSNNDDVYVLDRWNLLSDGNDIVDVSQSTEVPSQFMYSMALDVETVNKKFGVIQIVEGLNCKHLIGKDVTFSFRAKTSGSSLSNIKAAIISWSGTMDSVTSDIISAWNSGGTNPTLIANWTYENTPSNLTITNSWATYSVTANIDTASTTNVAVFIWSDVTTTTLADFLYITGTQLEVGTNYSQFEFLPYDVQYTRCTRYYERWNTSSVSSSYPLIAISINTTNALLQFPMKQKRNATSTTLNYSNIAHFRALGQVLATMTLYNRLDNFAIAFITTASTWTSGAAGFLTTDPSAPSTAYIDFTNEL